MKTILCFGDSNTYGFNPKNGKRFDENTRWSGILKKSLNGKFNVIEAGCNNRTAFNDNPAGEDYTGYIAIKKYLTKNTDILILSIGLNDLQKIYKSNTDDFNDGLKKIIDKARDINPNIEILLTSPSFINENILQSFFAELFDEDTISNSKKLQEIYKKVANKNNCKYINLEEITKTSKYDGLHYDEEGHKKIAEALTNIYLNFKF